MAIRVHRDHSMILSDSTLHGLIQVGYIGVEPYEPELLQPASLDVRLGNLFLINPWMSRVDLGKPVEVEYATHRGSYFDINPKQFVLACIQETLRLPADVQATVCGKSSLGRLGLFVENAGFIDPGFSGVLTLELFNASSQVLRVHAGMRIAQICFSSLDKPAERPYGSPSLQSHYQDQTGVTPSRWNPETPAG